MDLPTADVACLATSQCAEGLRCVEHVCRDEATIAKLPSTPTKEQPITPWFHGARGFVGATLGGAATAPLSVELQLALRAGVIWNGLQLMIEVSPGTTLFVPYTFGALDVTANVGGVLPITRAFAWILRVGGGTGFLYGYDCCSSYPPNPYRVPAYGELRFDLLGVALRASEHLVVEILAPSFRLLAWNRLASSEFIGSWFVTGTVEYVF